MDFFLGASIAIIAVVVVNSFVQKINRPNVNPMHSQSRSFELLKPFVLFSQDLASIKTLDTQVAKYINDNTFRILYIEDSAYWIENNALYVAKTIDGEIEKESAVQVDTMGMDKVELDKTIFIVETLREGFKNDFGYSGNEEF